MNPLYPMVAERAAGRCEYCHAPQATFNFSFEVEHITPTALGGSNTPENLGLACRACNSFKSARRDGIDPETGERSRLFHPRNDVWQEHFLIDLETMDMRGLTPVGRATVIALRLNTPFQRSARRIWESLELFP